MSVYVLLRDRFLVVGISANNRFTVDFSSLRISHFVWRASLFPMCSAFSQRSQHYEGYKEYFFARRNWFFGTMAVLFVADLFDDYIFHSVPAIHQFRVGLFILLSLLAIKLRNERFYAAFALFALLSEILFYLRQFFTFA